MPLGDSFDLSVGIVPVDLSVGNNVGKRVGLSEVHSVTVVLIKAAGTAAQDPILTLRQHTDASGGTSTDLAVIDKYWVKSEATLDGDEQWTEVTQTAAATITDPGGDGTSAESQQLVAFVIRADQLSPENGYISLDVADVGLNAQIGTALYILEITDRGTPDALLAPLR